VLVPIIAYLALEVDDEKRQRVVVVLAHDVVADHARLLSQGRINTIKLADDTAVAGADKGYG
jgi:hypothetical protein